MKKSERATESGKRVGAQICRAQDDSLRREATEAAGVFRVITVGGNGVQPGFDLARPRSIEVSEDEESRSISSSRANTNEWWPSQYP